MYDTIEEAMNALHTAEMDVAADMGEEAVEAGYSDLVHSIALLCSGEVADELFRRTGVGARV
jgi:hypothetical protein